MAPLRPPLTRTIWRRVSFSTAAFLLAAAACTGSAGGDGGSAGDDAGSTGASATAAASTSDGEICSVPEDEPLDPMATTTIVVRNDTATVQYLLPIFLTCDSEILSLEVEDLSPQPRFTDRPALACRDEDGTVRADAFCSYGCSDAAYPGTALAPGASLTIDWDGRAFSWVHLLGFPGCTPETVCGSPDGSLSCLYGASLSAGTPFTVAAHVTGTCPTPETPEACTCDAGTCPISVYDLTAPDPERILSVDGIVGQSAEIVITP